MLELITKLNCQKCPIWNVSWSPNGKILTSCGANKDIKFWEYNGIEWYCKETLSTEHSRTIRTVSWSPSGQYLTVASFDSTVSIWSKKSSSFTLCNVLEGHDSEVKCASWSSSETYLATCGRDRSVWIWEFIEDTEEFECVAILNVHSQDVKKVVWHPDLDILASCSYDNLIKLYAEDNGDWIVVDTLASHLSTVWSISFNKDGSRLASCSDDQMIKIWQNYKNSSKQLNYNCICTLSGYHDQPIFDISWCKDSNLIVTACGDNLIHVFKENEINCHSQDVNFILIESACFHNQDVNSVAWNPKNPELFAAASDDGTISLCHIKC